MMKQGAYAPRHDWALVADVDTLHDDAARQQASGAIVAHDASQHAQQAAQALAPASAPYDSSGVPSAAASTVSFRHLAAAAGASAVAATDNEGSSCACGTPRPRAPSQRPQPLPRAAVQQPLPLPLPVPVQLLQQQACAPRGQSQSQSHQSVPKVWPPPPQQQQQQSQVASRHPSEPRAHEIGAVAGHHVREVLRHWPRPLTDVNK